LPLAWNDVGWAPEKTYRSYMFLLTQYQKFYGLFSGLAKAS